MKSFPLGMSKRNGVTGPHHALKTACIEQLCRISRLKSYAMCTITENAHSCTTDTAIYVVLQTTRLSRLRVWCGRIGWQAHTGLNVKNVFQRYGTYTIYYFFCFLIHTFVTLPSASAQLFTDVD